MHDVAMAALSVFLMQSLAHLAPAPTPPACRRASLGARASRPHVGRRPTGVFKRARCPRSQGGVRPTRRIARGDEK